MPLLSKIKKFFEKNGEEQKQIEVERITFKELDQKINLEEINLEKERNELKNKVISISDVFINEAEGKIKVLNLINIDSKKEEEKLKNIVKDGLDLYIYCINELIINLKILSSLKTEDYFRKLLSAIQDFSRNSIKAREKATILIGKEIKETEDVIKSFLAKCNFIFNEYNRLNNKNEKLKMIKKMLMEFSESLHFEELLNKEVKSLNEIFIKNKDQLKHINNQITAIKNNLEYAQDLEKRDKFATEKQRLESEIRTIKEKINFKLLAEIYHVNNEKFDIVKKYSSNFKRSLIEDKTLDIVAILGEAKINGDIDLTLFGKIQEKIIKFENEIITESDKKLAVLENELKNINIFNSQTAKEIDEKNRKIEKLQATKENLKNEIKNQVQMAINGIKISENS